MKEKNKGEKAVISSLKTRFPMISASPQLYLLQTLQQRHAGDQAFIS